WAVQTLEASVPVPGLCAAESARRGQQLLALVRRGPPAEEVEAVRTAEAVSSVAALEGGRSGAPLKQKDAEENEWKVVTGEVKGRRGERWDAAQAVADRSVARWAAVLAERREAERRVAAAGTLQCWAPGLLGRRAAAAVRAARGAAVAGCAGHTAMALPAAVAQPARQGRRGRKAKEDAKGDDALLDDALLLAAREADELARAAADALVGEVRVAIVPYVVALTAEFGADAVTSAFCRLEAAARVAMGGLDSPMEVASASRGEWVVRFLDGEFVDNASDWATVVRRVENVLGSRGAG
ncbi:unnamed protein product, partial [Prorocentrum cordatum]